MATKAHPTDRGDSFFGLLVLLVFVQVFFFGNNGNER